MSRLITRTLHNSISENNDTNLIQNRNQDLFRNAFCVLHSFLGKEFRFLAANEIAYNIHFALHVYRFTLQ